MQNDQNYRRTIGGAWGAHPHFCCSYFLETCRIFVSLEDLPTYHHRVILRRIPLSSHPALSHLTVKPLTHHSHLDSLEVRHAQQERPGQFPLVNDGRDLLCGEQQCGRRVHSRSSVRVEITNGLVQDISRYLYSQEPRRLHNIRDDSNTRERSRPLSPTKCSLPYALRSPQAGKNAVNLGQRSGTPNNILLPCSPLQPSRCAIIRELRSH